MDVTPQTHDQRHLVYLTVRDVHVNQGNKRAQCNVQFRVELRDNQTYAPLTGAICLGKGPMATIEDSALSPVYYHNNDPTFDQVWIIQIPEDVKMMEGCHLWISLQHASSQPSKKSQGDDRGFAFLPLFQTQLQQLTASREYELPLYKLEKKQSDYLTNTGTLKPENKTIKVLYRLSSTKVLPDIDIHRFITWRHHPTAPVTAAVKRVARKNFVELLGIFDDLMKCVFEVMQDNKVCIYAGFLIFFCFRFLVFRFFRFLVFLFVFSFFPYFAQSR